MKKKLPDTGGKTGFVNSGADDEAKGFYNRIIGADDKCCVKGKKYYVSSSGSDANDGLTAQTPLGTLEAVKSLCGRLHPGDGVLLERGSVFRLCSDMNLVSGVTYCAYGKGKKPRIYGSADNYANPDIWQKSGRENIWKMSFLLCNPGIIVFDDGSESGKKQAKPEEITEEDDFFYDVEKQVLYLFCSRGNPGAIFSEIEIGTKTRLFHLEEGKRDIVIDNIAFAYTSLFGIRSDGKAENITVSNCEFSWLGGNMFDDATNRFGNGVEFCGGCNGIVVDNCYFNQIFDSGVTFQIGGLPFCNFTVRNCLFTYNGMSAFEWWTSGEQGEQDGWPVDITRIEHINIQNNMIRFTGFGWSKATRAPAHIRNGWNPKYYPNMKDFRINNNTFDCANGYIIASGWNDFPEEYKVTENTYYQCINKSNLPEKDTPVFGYPDEKAVCVGSEAEFANAIKVIDKHPKKIVWMA